MKNKFCLLILISISALALAQVDTLNVQEIQVVKSFVPEIYDSEKIINAPQFIDSIRISKSVRYNLLSKQFKGVYDLDTIKPATIKGEPLVKLYSNYLTLGLGNSSLPLVSASYNTQRSKSLNYGGRLLYNESYMKVASLYNQQDISAANRLTDASFFVKNVMKQGVLNANFSRQGNVFQAYGYDPALIIDDTDASQYWGYSKLNVSFESQHHRIDSLQFFANLLLSDLNESTENSIVFTADLSKAFDDLHYSLGLDFGLDLNNHAQDVDFSAEETKEAIYTFMPRVTKTVSNIFVEVGFNTSFVNGYDSSGVATQFYPHLRLGYTFSDPYQSAYAGIRGGIRENSMWNITKHNPFVLNTLNDGNADLNLINGSVVYDLFAGMKTKVSSSIFFDADVSYSRENDMLFFALDESSNLKNKFQAIYDDVNHLELSAQLKWDVNSSKGVYVDAAYHSYVLDSLATYSYRPTFEASLNAYYGIVNKFVLNARLKSEMGRSHLANTTDLVAVELNDIIDLDLSIEYKYNKVISANLKARNLFGGYEIWENYSVLSPLIQFSVSYQY